MSTAVQNTDQHIDTFHHPRTGAPMWTLRNTARGPVIDTHTDTTDLTLSVSKDGEVVIYDDGYDADRAHAHTAQHRFQQLVPGIHHPGEPLAKEHLIDGEVLEDGAIRRGDYLIISLDPATGADHYGITDVLGTVYDETPATLVQARSSIGRIAADEALLGRKSTANGQADAVLRRLIDRHSGSTEPWRQKLAADCTKLYRARNNMVYFPFDQPDLFTVFGGILRR